MQLRKYTTSDCGYLAELFYHTIHSVNAKDYTKEQLNVWATGTVDLKEWDESFLKHHMVVAVEHNEIVGFGDIDESGYLDRFQFKKFMGRKFMGPVSKTRQFELFIFIKCVIIKLVETN